MITFSKKPPEIALCDNPMFFRFTTDLPAGTENIALYIEPFYTDGNIFLGHDVLYPAPGGSADVLLGEYLRSGLQAPRQFAFPEQGNVPWNVRPNLIKKYYIRCNETWGFEPDHFTENHLLINRFVLRGRIPRWKKAAFYAQYASFSDFISSNMGLLTFSPSTLVTMPGMIQKMFFYIYWHTYPGANLTLRVRLYFDDGTIATFIPNQQTDEITNWSIYEFSVGYSILGLGNYAATNFPGKNLDYYDVTVMEMATQRSPVKTFVIDYNDQLSKHQFIFAGSLPGYDTLMATGIFKTETSFDYDNIDQQTYETANLADRKTAFRKSTETIYASTGYISAEYAEYLPEFFESNEVYEVIGSNLVPVIFHNFKIVRKEDSQNLFSCEFEYEHAIYQVTETD